MCSLSLLYLGVQNVLFVCVYLDVQFVSVVTIQMCSLCVGVYILEHV